MAKPNGRLPLSDWQRDHDRRDKLRHTANIKAIRGIKGEVALLTQRVTGMDDRLRILVDGTEPYVKLRQAVVKGSERAKTFGRYTTATVDWLLKYGKVGVLFIGAVVLWRAVAKGENPIEAYKIIWSIIAH